MINKFFAFFSFFLLIIILAGITFNEIKKNEILVVVELKQNEDPFTALKKIVPYDSVIMNVKEINKGDNKYQLTISTKRKKLNLLEWLNKNQRVENAKICEE